MSLDNENSHGEIPQENQAEMVKKWADPEHYKMEGVETIKIIEWFVSNPKRNLTEEQKFHCGQAIRYLLRCGLKDDPALDLQKIENYIHRARTGKWIPRELLGEK